MSPKLLALGGLASRSSRTSNGYQNCCQAVLAAHLRPQHPCKASGILPFPRSIFGTGFDAFGYLRSPHYIQRSTWVCTTKKMKNIICTMFPPRLPENSLWKIVQSLFAAPFFKVLLICPHHGVDISQGLTQLPQVAVCVFPCSLRCKEWAYKTAPERTLSCCRTANADHASGSSLAVLLDRVKHSIRYFYFFD